MATRKSSEAPKKTSRKKPPIKGKRAAPRKNTTAGVAQPAEQTPSKHQVAGSSPAPRSKPRKAPPKPADAKGTVERLLTAAPAQDPDAELNPRTLAFCKEYVRTFNGTASYLAANPGVKTNSAAVEAWRLLRNAKVRAWIEQHRAKLASEVDFSKADVIRELVAVATADPNELSQMRQVSCDNCWNDLDGNPPMWLEPNPECSHCGGEGIPRPWFADTRTLSPAARRLFAGVKVTKNGMEILTRDIDGALDKLAKVFGAYEADNEQKGKPAAEVLREFLGHLHSGAARLQVVPPKGGQPAGPGLDGLVKG